MKRVLILKWILFSLTLLSVIEWSVCGEKEDYVSKEQLANTKDYDFEEVLKRHKRQCACLSQYTPVNCKCQQADPTNSNDLACRCDRATVSPQCSCAPTASTLCFPVCQQQCIQSCVAQQQSVPQCQPPCQLICQRACQTLPQGPVYATLQPLQVAGQQSQQPPPPQMPLPVAPGAPIVYAIPQSPASLPHAPQSPSPSSSNAQSIGQATVYLPTQAQCIPLCTEQCMKNCPNSPGQCAQTCTNGCQVACSRQPLQNPPHHDIVVDCSQRCEPSCQRACAKLPTQHAQPQPMVLLSTCQPACVSMCQSNCQVNQPGPPQPLPLSPHHDLGCVSLCRPDCSPKCTRQFVEEPNLSTGNLVLAQVGNRETAASVRRAPEEFVVQATPPYNDFDPPSNTRTIFESEYFIPLDGSSKDIVIPIALPSQQQQTLEINLGPPPRAAIPYVVPPYLPAPPQYYQVPQNQSKVYEIPAQTTMEPANNESNLGKNMESQGMLPANQGMSPANQATPPANQAMPPSDQNVQPQGMESMSQGDSNRMLAAPTRNQVASIPIPQYQGNNQSPYSQNGQQNQGPYASNNQLQNQVPYVPSNQQVPNYQTEQQMGSRQSNSQQSNGDYQNQQQINGHSSGNQAPYQNQQNQYQPINSQPLNQQLNGNYQNQQSQSQKTLNQQSNVNQQPLDNYRPPTNFQFSDQQTPDSPRSKTPESSKQSPPKKQSQQTPETSLTRSKDTLLPSDSIIKNRYLMANGLPLYAALNQNKTPINIPEPFKDLSLSPFSQQPLIVSQPSPPPGLFLQNSYSPSAQQQYYASPGYSAAQPLAYAQQPSSGWQQQPILQASTPGPQLYHHQKHQPRVIQSLADTRAMTRLQGQEEHRRLLKLQTQLDQQKSGKTVKGFGTKVTGVGRQQNPGNFVEGPGGYLKSPGGYSDYIRKPLNNPGTKVPTPTTKLPNPGPLKIQLRDPTLPQNDGLPHDEITLNIEFPGHHGIFDQDKELQRQCASCPLNCSRQCVQQLNKGFKVTATEAQSFFRRRFSKLRSTAEEKSVNENGNDVKAEDYWEPKREMSQPRRLSPTIQQLPIGGSGRKNGLKSRQGDCHESCKRVCGRACEQHRMNMSDFKCAESCLQECSQKCPKQ